MVWIPWGVAVLAFAVSGVDVGDVCVMVGAGTLDARSGCAGGNKIR